MLPLMGRSACSGLSVPLAAGRICGYGCRQGQPGVSNGLGVKEADLSPEQESSGD